MYHAHSASVTSISISPFPPPVRTRPDSLSRLSAEELASSIRSSAGSISSLSSSRSPRPPVLPATPSNSIYIATSSIDGNVCVASLVDPKDVMLRNFGRPVQAVALSPEYKHDRTYLSGGLAGNLILTVGGRAGTSTTSTTIGGAAAAASGWLGSLGLGANTGKDTILHSGEGSISTIKWSLSGKYVTWVNEEGIKIMRTNLHLDSSDSELAWKRISHIDRPNRPGWEEMASVWKARAEWVDESSLESDSDSISHHGDSTPSEVSTVGEKVEKLVVGWGGTIWVINVYPDRSTGGRKTGSAEVATMSVVSFPSRAATNRVIDCGLIVLFPEFRCILPDCFSCLHISKQRTMNQKANLSGPGLGLELTAGRKPWSPSFVSLTLRAKRKSVQIRFLSVATRIFLQTITI